MLRNILRRLNLPQFYNSTLCFCHYTLLWCLPARQREREVTERDSTQLTAAWKCLQQCNSRALSPEDTYIRFTAELKYILSNSNILIRHSFLQTLLYFMFVRISYCRFAEFYLQILCFWKLHLKRNLLWSKLHFEFVTSPRI